MNSLVLMRWLGSAGCIVSYALVVNGSVVIGTALNLLTNFLFSPYYVRHRMWDLLAIEAFFLVINVHALAPLLFS